MTCQTKDVGLVPLASRRSHKTRLQIEQFQLVNPLEVLEIAREQREAIGKCAPGNEAIAQSNVLHSRRIYYRAGLPVCYLPPWPPRTILIV
jgi:hypothetical protein